MSQRRGHPAPADGAAHDHIGAPSGCAWDEIVGQPRVVEFLKRATSDGAASHAYLFVGPPGAGKKSAARALACALLCKDGGCGGCPVCQRIRRGVHPDVRVFVPEGAAGYLVEQVRDEIMHDVALKPIEAAAKVYILDRAETFNAAAANAFLKTLEEPPEGVTIVLLSTSYEAVIETVASRCQVVRFAQLTPASATALLVERTGASEDEALAALAASGGVVPRALEFLRTPARAAARARVLEVMRDLPVMDGLDVLGAARELLSAVRAPLDEVKARQEGELRERAEFLGRTGGSTKAIEERHKRELTAREREGIGEIVNVAESWLRDALASSVGEASVALNRDAADEAAAAGSCLSAAAAAQALAAVGTARRRISYNVGPQLVVEAMLFDIQEALICPRSWE